MHRLLFACLLAPWLGCLSPAPRTAGPAAPVPDSVPLATYDPFVQPPDPAPPVRNIRTPDTALRSIHVLVALCDNQYQGIVPVPAGIGNGQDPNSNLYWGCGYGVRTYFQKSPEWRLLQTRPGDTLVMERLIFEHIATGTLLVADAWNGRWIRPCTRAFLRGCAGIHADTLHVRGRTVGLGGNASLLAYIGHDGLMDFALDESFANADGKQRDCIVLACISQEYFGPHLKAAGARPLVWTTGLMAPEAYTLHDALSAWLAGAPAPDVRTRAAQAYARYQKCSEKAARNLLVQGW